MIDWPDSTRQILLYRYPRLDAPERFYSALCLALSGRGSEIDWAAWSADEWQALGEMAVQEGVAPLLHWTWKHEGYPQGVPKLEKKRLAISFMQANVRQQAFFQEVNERILPALTLDIAPLVLLKGAALAQTIYPHPALRLMGDLDILVRLPQVDPAVRRLALAGYDQITPYPGPLIRRLLSHHVHVSAPRLLSVEVHYALVVPSEHRYAPNLDWFWTQIEPLSAWPGVYGLAPTACLLYLAAHHMLQHGQAEMTLLKCYDIHLLVSRCGERIDWDELARQAVEQRWSAALLAALQAATLHFQTPLPADYLISLQAAISDQNVDLAVVEQRAQVASQTKLGNWKIALGVLPWSQKLAVLREAALPTPAYMRWRYPLRPAWLWPLAYFVRWFNGVRDAVRFIGMWLERDRSP